MKKKQLTRFQLLKAGVIGFSLVNLAALFLFQYKLPAFTSKTETSDTETSKSVQDTDVSACQFQFESDTLTYDGTSELDLLEGVSIVSSEGETCDAEIFAHIATGDSMEQKKIMYSADTSQGQISATRTLSLINYQGISISLPDLPELEESQLDNILTYMPTDGTFYAEDGYGNNITDAISVEYTIDADNPSIVHYFFSVTNLFNDTASASKDLIINSDRPILVLKEKDITIAKNSSFQALSFVEKAQDSEGNSLFHRINIEGKVDTSKAGTYTLTYTASTTDGVTSIPQVLTIVVE